MEEETNESNSFDDWYQESLDVEAVHVVDNGSTCSTASNFYSVSGFNSFMEEQGQESMKMLQQLTRNNESGISAGTAETNDAEKHASRLNMILKVEDVVNSFAESIQESIKGSSSNIHILR